MAKRKFAYNFPSTVERTIKEYGSKSDPALMRVCFDVNEANNNVMEAVLGGDADTIAAAIKALELCVETLDRLHARLNNVDSEAAYQKFGRGVTYDEGVDMTTFFETMEA